MIDSFLRFTSNPGMVAFDFTSPPHIHYKDSPVRQNGGYQDKQRTTSGYRHDIRQHGHIAIIDCLTIVAGILRHLPDPFRGAQADKQGVENIDHETFSDQYEHPAGEKSIDGLAGNYTDKVLADIGAEESVGDDRQKRKRAEHGFQQQTW